METVQAPLKADLGAPQLDDSDPSEPVFVGLVMEERDRLNAIFKDPVFVKAWRNLRCFKPGAFPGNQTALASPIGLQLASNRLHQIQGWEMLVVALINQGKEPVQKKKTALEQYPDAGTIEAEMERLGGPVPARAVPGQPVAHPKPPSGPMPVAKTPSHKIRKP